MQETADKHKLQVELAVTIDRLAKQDEAISVQKNQYEDRLKRVYDEKDNHIIEYRHLQKEVKSMQENLALQTMQQQNMLAQQNLLHEQSENRWLKLIDQARQEAKDTYKKYQKISTDSDEQIKRLNSMLADLQKSIFEKDTHIKIAQEKVSQLKQEIKSLETEHINARTIIMKLKGERESRNTKHKYKTDSIA
jgi:chromosome segregation ATPase